MAIHLFTQAILAGEPIRLYNEGRMRRDFTYIDDIVEGAVRLIDHLPTPDATWSASRLSPDRGMAPFRIYNVGNHRPVELTHFIETLERCLGRKAKWKLLPLEPIDVPETCADVDDLMRDVGFEPSTPLETGVERYVEWHREYYRITAGRRP
jgi:UDP-glucuronate 4-epimerase